MKRAITNVEPNEMFNGEFPARSVQAGMWQKSINRNT